MGGGDPGGGGGWRRPLKDPTAGLEMPPQVEQWVRESLLVAQQAKDKGSVRQACEAWRQILAVAPSNAQCLQGLATAALDNSRYDEAIDYSCQLIATARVGPGRARVLEEVWELAGRAALGGGDYPAALQFLNRAMEVRLEREPSAACDELQVLLDPKSQSLNPKRWSGLLEREPSGRLR